jgi:hypothetical protein
MDDDEAQAIKSLKTAFTHLNKVNGLHAAKNPHLWDSVPSHLITPA